MGGGIVAVRCGTGEGAVLWDGLAPCGACMGARRGRERCCGTELRCLVLVGAWWGRERSWGFGWLCLEGTGIVIVEYRACDVLGAAVVDKFCGAEGAQRRRRERRAGEALKKAAVY